MDNMIQTPTQALSYQGQVFLKFKIKNKIYPCIVHNQGLPDMFHLITLAIAGKDPSTYVPTNILIGKTSGSTFTTKAFVPLTSKSVVSDSTYSYVNILTALIAKSDIQKEIQEDDEMYLTSNHNTVIKLAKISITNEIAYILNNLSDGVEGQIEWKIRIYNGTDTVTGE